MRSKALRTPDASTIAIVNALPTSAPRAAPASMSRRASDAETFCSGKVSATPNPLVA